jgi:Ferritin-like
MRLSAIFIAAFATAFPLSAMLAVKRRCSLATPLSRSVQTWRTCLTDKTSALEALDVIVEQGEGSPADTQHSHYRRFIAIRDSYDGFLAQFPGFDPSRPVAPNPVMRMPPSPGNKTYVDDPAAAMTLDFVNALYGAMLRSLVQGFSERDLQLKRVFFDTAIDGMFAISPIAQHLTRLPASPRSPGLNAGITFAMLRDVAPMPDGVAAITVLAERLRQLADGAHRALTNPQLAKEASATMRRLADRLDEVGKSSSPDRAKSRKSRQRKGGASLLNLRRVAASTPAFAYWSSHRFSKRTLSAHGSPQMMRPAPMGWWRQR